jgi:hypothetical protein
MDAIKMGDAAALHPLAFHAEATMPVASVFN